MREIKTFLTPVFDNSLKTNYYINDDLIIKIELLKTDIVETEMNESDETKEVIKGKVEEVVDVEYVDLQNIEDGKTYVNTSLYVKNIKVENGILFFEVINYIPEDSPEEIRFPKWITPEKSEFEIPEDAKVIHLEELMIEPPENENDRLKSEIHGLKQLVADGKRENEQMLLDMLDLLSGV